MAMKLSWNPPGNSKVLVHICDCPAHGLKYHNFASSEDRHHGDGPRLLPAVQAVRDLGVDYLFCEITEHTQKMVEQLNSEVRMKDGDHP